MADDLAAVGITEPFPIQTLALPLALQGSDLIGQARTGTGKTLAFGIALLQRISPGGTAGDKGAPQALVVVPTRELATQVARDLEAAGRTLGARVVTIYGGRAYEPQVEALRAGVDVVVGTPGRLLDLAGQRHLDLSAVRVLVLDEADEMLDLGFLPDVERILGMLPTARQSMLFSATMPAPVVALARRYLDRPTHVRAEHAAAESAPPATEQHVFRAHDLDKSEILSRLLQAEGRGLTMVFCRTKRATQRVADDLVRRGFAVAAVHGDLGQGQREQALRAFRAGKVDVLVATDVAARGIDVPDVTHVVNYSCPDDETTYLHRIGRTGRAGRPGTAVTLVDWADLARWKMINEALGLPFPEPVETYSTSEHLREALDIPAGVSGTLPRDARTRAGLAAERLEDLGGGRARVRRRGRPVAAGSLQAAAVAAASDDGTSEAGVSDSEGRSTPARRSRSRRRTRAGVPVGATVTTLSVPGEDVSEAGEAAGGGRRRRRRRGGRGSGSGVASDAASSA
ncbi:MAG TPA: DEAD/DEAH box helicase [Mycobacteriales bacterium]|nr:DEAD/DEAH box helicase [Mycobacteriales bacterium]